MASIIANKLVKPRDGIDFSRSVFPYLKRHSTNMQAGYIVPVHTQFLYPGTSPKWSFGCVVESAPLISTCLDNIYIDIVSIWTPLRLVMTDFNEFLGESHSQAFTLNRNITIPKLDTVYMKTHMPTGGASQADSENATRAYIADRFLAPHLGYRMHEDITFSTDTHVAPDSIYKKGISVLPSRIYELNYNTFFRNENLTDPILIDKTSVVGSHDTAEYSFALGRLRKANKLKTYYNVATPAPSLLDVSLSLGDLMPVVTGALHSVSGIDLQWVDNSGNALTSNTYGLGFYSNGSVSLTKAFPGGQSGSNTNVEPANLYADMASLTVNKMYYALMEQRFANKMMKGRRAVEFYANFFGVKDSDAGHDLPTLVCQKRYPINISPVIATATSSDGDETSQLGQRGAFSTTGFGDSLVTNFTATEHGYFQTYAIIRGQPSLYQGIDHFLGIDSLLDTYIPEFDHIGPVGIERLSLGELDTYSIRYYGYTNAWFNERYQYSDVAGIIEPGQPLAYKTLAFTPGPTVTSNVFYEPKYLDHIFMFPIYYGTPYGSGFDQDGAAFEQNRYQFLIQFAVKGEFAAVMSPDSEPLKLRF